MKNFIIKPLFNTCARVLATTAEEIRQQIKAQFTEKEIKEMFGDMKYQDQYDERMYSLYQDSNDNYILITTGTVVDEYETDENKLPDTDDIFMELLDDAGPYEEVMLELIKNKNRIVFFYQWSDSEADCIVIKDKDLYNLIKDNNYFNIVGYIEEYVCDVTKDIEKKYDIARIVDKVYKKY